jgi:hypothetical protein
MPLPAASHAVLASTAVATYLLQTHTTRAVSLDAKVQKKVQGLRAALERANGLYKPDVQIQSNVPTT